MVPPEQACEESAGGVLVTLRPVEAGDLPTLYEFEQDAAANRMAVARPRNADAFHQHWDRILADSDTVVRTILVGGSVAGTVNCFPIDQEFFVGYWVGKPFWGRGVATRALGLLLGEATQRPLLARIATSNIGSRRVAERCGFVQIESRTSPETERFPACEETLYRLG